jgi:putative ABC transport system permease protein
MMNHFPRQLVYAVRRLRRSPGFTLSALIILALGIGANTAIFSVVNAVLLRPLPFPHSDSIVSILHVPPPKGSPGLAVVPVSAANYLDWRRQNDVFESMAVIGGRMFRVGGGDRPQALLAAVTDAGFFGVLQARPEAGRVFTSAECEPGRDAVIVVSHAFAQQRFGSARNAVGRTLVLNKRNVSIIGVMPASFYMPSWFPTGKQAWAPLAWTPQDRAVRGDHDYFVAARLRDGVSVRQAQTQMDVISHRLARAYPEEDAGWGVKVSSLRDFLVGDVRPALLTLLGAVGFVLLIACANITNLMLARTISRRKELAIRAALGASDAQVVLPVVIETVLLSIAGGALGLGVATAGQRLVVAALAEQMPRATEIHIDARVLGFTLAASLLTGIVAGLIACWKLMSVDPQESLKQGLGKTDAVSGGHRTRNTLVAAEVAASLILLIGAGLMIRSLMALHRVDPGFDAANVVTMSVPLPQAANGTHNRFYDEFLAPVRNLPGVQAAAAIDNLPLDGGGPEQAIVVDDRLAEAPALRPSVSVRLATPGYFQTMRIPLAAGRDFGRRDTVGRTPVVIVSEAMARQLWPGQNAVGRRLRISSSPDVVREVVGIAGDVKDRGIDALAPVPMLYQPLLRDESGGVSLVVRATADPARLVPAIGNVLKQLNPDLPIRNVETLDDVVASSLSQHRFTMYLFAALAALAFLLSAAGIYSLLSYNVRTRTHEISVRMALGAEVRDVLRMVVLEGLRPTLAGVAIGAFGAYAASGILSKLVFGVTATDPFTFAFVAILLTTVALFACAVPAWRATKVEPVSALRNE